MSADKYIVLRGRSVMAPTMDNFGFGAGSRSLDSPHEAMELEEADLTIGERSELRRDPSVRAIAPPMAMKLVEPVEIKDVEVSAMSMETWGVKAVRAPDSPYDGQGITVAVLDTGIDPGHPAFQGVELVRRNFTSEGDDDTNGHGTHCAGTIFGRDVLGKRIGIATQVRRAVIGKVLGEGGGSSGTIARAIEWAIAEGAHVISMSLGIDFPGYVKYLVEVGDYDMNPATSLALEAYRANINLFGALADFVKARSVMGQGSVIVSASGNESRRPEYEIAVAPPAAGTGIVSVGALRGPGNELDVAYFSNNQVDISAPGVDIVSAALGGGLTSMSGTSMATPHAAGVAALWAHRQLQLTGHVESPSLTAQLIASGTFAPLVAGIEEEDVGTGIVQAPLD